MLNYSVVNSNGSGYHEVGHDQAQSHEMYIYPKNSDDYIILMRDKHKGFLYLFPPYPDIERIINNGPFL